jgi:predicted DNA binding CopG/RHH family protein
MTLLEKICAQFNSADLSYALVGGYAAAFYGANRPAVTIDVVVEWSKQSLDTASNLLNEMGLVSHLPITASDLYDFRDEYIQNRNLTAWNFQNPDDSTEQVNIITTYSLSPDKVTELDIDGTTIPVLALSELAKMQETAISDNNDEAATDTDSPSPFWFANFYKEAAKNYKVSNPYDVANFLDNCRRIQSAALNTSLKKPIYKQPSKLISIKVPVDLLAAFKAKAKLENLRYQTQIKQLMTDWLNDDSK